MPVHASCRTGPDPSHCEYVRAEGGEQVAWWKQGWGAAPLLVIAESVSHVVLDASGGPAVGFFKALSKHRTVVRFDLPGTGLSTGSLREGGLACAVDAAERVCQAARLRTVQVLSFGLGHRTALGLAERRPDLVVDLVLLGHRELLSGDGERVSELYGALATIIDADWDLGSSALARFLAPSASPRQLYAYASHLRTSTTAGSARDLIVGLTVLPTPVVPSSASRVLRLGGHLTPRRDTEDVRRLPVDDQVPFFGAMEPLLATLEERHGRPPVLTEREVLVLQALASGLGNRAIGSVFGISEHTVAKHISNIYRKLDVNNRCSAVARTRQLGLLDEGDLASHTFLSRPLDPKHRL